MAKPYQCSLFIAISFARESCTRCEFSKRKTLTSKIIVSNKSYYAQCRIIVEEKKDESSLCLSYERVNNVKLQWHLKQILSGIFIIFFI